ncbi:carboxylesterase [Colletotrichum plurivorum]|uniref:Carboxylesterase n=1 Tax=Colletotrichum plurivorum TaxID=2175906 RepID=A0A8H6KJA7_9PEZI|nr:carboxylesterase [Colletotrichum plurivorum]
MTKQPEKKQGLKWTLALPVAAAALLGYFWSGQVGIPGLRQSTKAKYSPAASVKIDQGTILGRLVTDGTFPEPLEGFMGIPYALPPVGQLRFRHAVPVAAGNGTLETFELGPRSIRANLFVNCFHRKYLQLCRCPGKQLVPFTDDEWLGPDWESEDCLTINVYRPKGHTADKKLPVAVMIPGGAFNRGAARMHNTPSMLAWSEEPWIGVSMQYRIGVAGGMNAGLTAREGLLNLGLKDMYVALEWVQKNIAAFGGDPDDVTIMGLSAAAHGIGHLVMDINQKKHLFHKAIMDSGAHTARAVHWPYSELNEAHFQEFLGLTGCNNRPDHEILPCLRAVPPSTIIESGQKVYEKSNPSVRWAWQPVIDYEIISRRPIDAEMEQSPHSYWFNPQRGCHIRPSTQTPSTPRQDLYTCPVRQTAVWGSRSPAVPPVYLYHWALNKTAIYGANHGDQMRYQTYNAEVRSISPKQDEIAGFMHSYATSFIVHGDPNKIKGRFDKRPEWLPFAGKDGNDAGKTMVFGEGNDERAGGSRLGTSAQFTDYKWAEKECRFWWKQTENSED